jgi:hypothetical protein
MKLIRFTSADHDDSIDPGAGIQITFERLGILGCQFAEPSGNLLPSRWPLREPLKKYHGPDHPDSSRNSTAI